MLTRITIAACVLALFAGIAAAQPARDPAAARKHFEQAEAYLKAELYDKAAGEYQAAYDLSGKTVLLYNVGLAREKQGELEAAVAAYDRYLAAEPDGVKSAEARARVEALRRRVVELELEAERKLEAERQAEAERKAAAERRAAEEARAGEPDPVASEPEEPPPPSRRSMVPAYVAGGVAALAGAVGIGFGLSSRATLSDLDDALATGTPPLDTGDPRFDEGRRKALYADLAFATAGTALVVAGVLAYRALAGGDTDRRAALRIAPSSGGAAVEVRW